MTPFIFNPSATFRQVTVNRIDVGLWSLGQDTLVLATNMNYATGSVTLADLGLENGVDRVTQVYNGGSQINASGGGLTFESVGSGGFVVKT